MVCSNLVPTLPAGLDVAVGKVAKGDGDRAVLAAKGGVLENQRDRAGVSLLFATGTRPSVTDIDSLLSAPLLAGAVARISHRPADGEGWLELLASGLTFDLTGLAPADPAPTPEARHFFGLPGDMDRFALEGVSLTPGDHVSAGGAMLPVIKVLIGLAANLALQLPVHAVCWHPAGCWMDTRYFTRIVLGWLSGGPFPALGLTGIRQLAGGGVESSGLAFFCGQEIEIRPARAETGAETFKLAGRVIDHILRAGPLQQGEKLQGPGGEALVAHLTQDSRHATILRGL